MFEFTCRLEPADLEFVIKDIYSFVEENGWISKKELIGRMAPHIKVQPGDVISHPAHYTEGRKYEPRKVVADWGLSFNLGNAVKYLALAGRKGDKIEDLRKAIQYIEFEIDECLKHSEYEELLNSFKSRPPEEQVKIVKQLKLELNKKYGIGGLKDE